METTRRKTVYWVAKGFISFFMLFSAYFSYSHPADLQALGFPDYFRIELVIAKVMGAVLLLIPQVSLRVKEWIYAGFMITMISAMIAHICSHDPIGRVLFVAVDFILIVTCIQVVYKYEHQPVAKIS
jgi:putative oxidoreductase